MNIGFTYDLKDQYLAEGYSKVQAAEFDSIETIEGVERAIQRLGHRVDRIGKLDSLVRRLARGDRWDLVFNIAEGLRGATRESQVPALLEAYDIPTTFGDSLCLALCLHKGHSKQVVKSHRIPTSRFVVVDDKGFDFNAVTLTYPLFAKPVGEGTGKGVMPRGKVDSPDKLREVCFELLDRFAQPVLVEEFLPGREFTVGVVGTGRDARVLGVMEVVLLVTAEPEVYTFDNKDKYEDRVTYRLVNNDGQARMAAEIALESYRVLNCRDAGRVDIRSDQYGMPQFMEINPLAGLNPLHSDLPILCRLLGVSYEQLISDILASALRRVRHVS
ncbi:MAG: D-alanine--D-alanine ligase [Planctomycetaceae bacterium]|nr:D-alanine--D-alanine ligase [Planctomycetaceae bacterium]